MRVDRRIAPRSSPRSRRPHGVPQRRVRDADRAVGERRRAAAQRARALLARDRIHHRRPSRRSHRATARGGRRLPGRPGRPRHRAVSSRGRRRKPSTCSTVFVGANPANPNRIPARLMLGQALLSQGRSDDSASQFRAVLDADPSSIAANQGMGAVVRVRAARALEQGNVAQAAVAGARGAAAQPRRRGRAQHPRRHAGAAGSDRRGRQRIPAGAADQPATRAGAQQPRARAGHHAAA